METERRTFEIDGLEVRALEDGAPLITGYAVVFDSPSEIMYDMTGRPFREYIAPGAFDRVLAGNPDIRALWNHNDDYPLARTRNNTLRIAKDVRGLRIEVRPAETTWGMDATKSIRRGDVSGMSFAFAVHGDKGHQWKPPGADGVATRTILDADLYEVSPVTFPAYPATQVTVRSVTVPDWTESDGQEAGEIAAEAPAQERPDELIRRWLQARLANHERT